MSILKKIGLFSLALLLTCGVHAQHITTDPILIKALNRSNWEPGGKYYSFGSSRGAVDPASRTGSVTVVPINSLAVGNFVLENANISGNYGYVVRFSGHPASQHSPVNDTTTSSDSAKSQNQDGTKTAYSISWAGTLVHPADAYDGKQGGGYPAPTGARDEYSFNIKGIATGTYIAISNNIATISKNNNGIYYTPNINTNTDALAFPGSLNYKYSVPPGANGNDSFIRYAKGTGKIGGGAVILVGAAANCFYDWFGCAPVGEIALPIALGSIYNGFDDFTNNGNDQVRVTDLLVGIDPVPSPYLAGFAAEERAAIAIGTDATDIRQINNVGAIGSVVTAKGTVNGVLFEDVNQTARIGATNEPSLIADRIIGKVAEKGKLFPNGTIAESHAEIGVIQKAYNAGETQGSEMTMIVYGKDVCGYCKGDIAAAASAAGLKSLTVQAVDNFTNLPKNYYWKPGMASIKNNP